MNPRDQYIMQFTQHAEKLGHKLVTLHESMPDLYDDDDEGNMTDMGAYSNGYHNGPKCKECASSWCEHCVEIDDMLLCGESATFNADNSNLVDWALPRQLSGDADILPTLLSVLSGRHISQEFDDED